MRALFPLALVVLGACSSVETNATPDVVELSPMPTVSVTAAPTTTALVRREEPPPSKLDGWTLPNLSGPKLGEACTARAPSEEADRRGPDVCGVGGRVSLEYDGYRPMRGTRPCEMRRLGPEERRNLYQTSACVDGDHLVMTSDCMVCRTTSGWSAHARLSALTPEQSKFLFGRLSYGEAKEAPTSAAAWRKLVGDAPVDRPSPDLGP